MREDDLLALLHDTADAVAAALDRVDDWGLSGAREGQYRADLQADEAGLAVLRRAGVGILSEESGLEASGEEFLVVIDPLDGSTNAAHGIPFYATALCALGPDGPVAALVANQATGERYHAVRSGGAWCGDRRLEPSTVTRLAEAVIAVNGYPSRHLGWGQFRAFGSVALELCLVADGVLDGYVDCVGRSHGVWDYGASVLICREAGVPAVDAFGEDLFVRDVDARRTVVAAATAELLEELREARPMP